MTVRGGTGLSCLRPRGLPGNAKYVVFKQLRLLAEDVCFK